jgi:hypothetical protein
VGGRFHGNNIDIDGDGNNDFTSNGSVDGYAAKFDSNGNLVWAKQLGGSGSDIAYSITTDSSGNVLVGGSFAGNIDIDGDGNNDFTSNGSDDGYAAKFDSNGNLVWAKQIGGSSNDRAYSITTDSSGNVLVGVFLMATLTSTAMGTMILPLMAAPMVMQPSSTAMAIWSGLNRSAVAVSRMLRA